MQTEQKTRCRKNLKKNLKDLSKEELINIIRVTRRKRDRIRINYDLSRANLIQIKNQLKRISDDITFSGAKGSAVIYYNKGGNQHK